MRELFDPDALEPEAGVRALWLLYRRGQWGRLEDFGIERAAAEPLFKQFEAENVVVGRLTKAQVKTLTRLIPELHDAGVELRLAYALKFIEQGVFDRGTTVLVEGATRKALGSSTRTI